MAELLEDIRDKGLIAIAEKVLAGAPIDEADCLYLLEVAPALELGRLAHAVRLRLHGRQAFYGVNMNLNYTNACELRCPLCAFSCDRDDARAYVYSLDEIEQRVRQACAFGIDEVHIVGGLRDDLKLDYFEQMLKRIKSVDSKLFIVAFTAAEYDYFARLNQVSLEEVFERLIAAGLGALPGGGAEIFAEPVRQVIAPKKISGERWLEVMRVAHGFGLKTNATILYNHIETPADVVDHLSRLRALQDATGGFKTFVPLAYHDEHTQVKARRPVPTGLDELRLYATARVYLHNIPHIKGLWMYLGEKMAQTLLNFGVDDLGSTYHYEKVVHSAGARTADYGSEQFLRNLIEMSGFTPVRTAANYAGVNA